MKKNHREYLEHCLDNVVFEGYGQLSGFFKVYAMFNVHNIHTLIKAPKGFFSFLMDNVDRIRFNHPFTRAEKEMIIRNTVSALNNDIRNMFGHAHSSYADVVHDLFPNKSTRILDVGAGEIPSTSIMLGKKKHFVTAMDNSFLLHESSLEPMRVTPVEQYFDVNTSVDKVDAITGRCPCGAIIDIVRSASSKNKPYFMELCSCELPTVDKILNGNLPDMDKLDIPKLLSRVEFDEIYGSVEDMIDWSDILPMYDKDIKVIGKYATNLDISSDTFRKILARHHIPVGGVEIRNKNIDTNSNVSIKHLDKGRVTIGTSYGRSIDLVKSDNADCPYWSYDYESLKN